MPGMAAQGAVPLDDGLGLGLGGHYGLEPGGGSPFDGAVGVGGHGHGGGGAGRPNQKQRFVWTAELHRRFETAVNTLGIDHAKPQAISQLMKCEGEGAPTRQNIKSHLQKYRLLMQKRGKAGASAGTLMATLTPSASCASLADQDEPSTSADTGMVAAAVAASAAVPGKAAAAPQPAVERDG